MTGGMPSGSYRPGAHLYRKEFAIALFLKVVCIDSVSFKCLIILSKAQTDTKGA
jgi:hypothetical protein